MENQNLNLFMGLAKYADKEEILNSILIQLEKDTGLDYTKANTENPMVLGMLRKDLSAYLKKIAEQNKTRFMHLIYRVDILQSKMNSLQMSEFYYNELAEMVLNRMFQKIITKRLIKT